jgi:hypothetical protein
VQIDSKPTVLLGVRIAEDMKTQLDDAVGKAAYEHRDSVTLAGLGREILGGWLAGEAS